MNIVKTLVLLLICDFLLKYLKECFVDNINISDLIKKSFDVSRLTNEINKKKFNFFCLIEHFLRCLLPNYVFK